MFEWRSLVEYSEKDVDELKFIPPDYVIHTLTNATLHGPASRAQVNDTVVRTLSVLIELHRVIVACSIVIFVR
jgi:hypothetical protein